MSIFNVRDALLEALARVYHYSAPVEVVDSGDSYVVWGETGIDALSADDGPVEWTVSGMVYFYTGEEYDETFDMICASLAAHDISIRPGRIGYDDARKETAYELTWSIVCEPFAIYAEPEDDE